MIHNRRPLWKNAVFFLFLLFVAVFLIQAALRPYEDMIFDREAVKPLNEGWHSMDSEGKEITVILPVKLEIPAGSASSVYRTLTNELSSPAVLCFRSSQQSVRVFLDGNVIYEYGIFPGMRAYGKSGGSLWNLVRLPEDSIGRKLTIELSSPYSDYSGQFSEIHTGTKAALMFYLLRTHFLSAALVILIIVAGIALLFVYFILIRRHSKDKTLYYLGIFSILVALWMLGETRMIQFYTGNILLSMFITFITMLSFPIPLLKYIASVEEFRYQKLFHLLTVILYLQLTIILALQYFNILDFIELVRIMHLVLLITAGTALFAILSDLFCHKNKNLRITALSLLLFTLFGGIEAVMYYVRGGRQTGYYLRVGVLLFISLQALQAIRKAIGMISLSYEAAYYEKLATRDALTHCLNRSAYNRYMDDSEKRAAVSSAAMMVDLNNLKIINDTCGHETGDDAIIRCARCMDSVFQYHGDCFRIGGDEFLFLGEDLSVAEMESLLTEFLKQCEQESLETSYEFIVAAGYAVFDESADSSLSDTVRRADIKMYQMKEFTKHRNLSKDKQ